MTNRIKRYKITVECLTDMSIPELAQFLHNNKNAIDIDKLVAIEWLTEIAK